MAANATTTATVSIASAIAGDARLLADDRRDRGGVAWNFPQHVTRRYSPSELAPRLDRLTDLTRTSAALARENRILRSRAEATSP